MNDWILISAHLRQNYRSSQHVLGFCRGIGKIRTGAGRGVAIGSHSPVFLSARPSGAKFVRR